MTSEDADYTFEIKETDIATLDKASSNVTAVAEEGETTVRSEKRNATRFAILREKCFSCTAFRQEQRG